MALMARLKAGLMAFNAMNARGDSAREVEDGLLLAGGARWTERGRKKKKTGAARVWAGYARSLRKKQVGPSPVRLGWLGLSIFCPKLFSYFSKQQTNTTFSLKLQISPNLFLKFCKN